MYYIPESYKHFQFRHGVLAALITKCNQVLDGTISFSYFMNHLMHFCSYYDRLKLSNVIGISATQLWEYSIYVPHNKQVKRICNLVLEQLINKHNEMNELDNV